MGFASHFERYLSAVLASRPDRTLVDEPLVSSTDMRRLLEDWNDTASRYARDATVPALFARQVALSS